MAKTHQFYESFRLTLERLSLALGCIRDNPNASREQLARCMNVNVPIGRGFMNWLRHTGLVVDDPGNPKGKVLTPFGSLAAEHDPGLRDLGTQWLLHYYLATEHSEKSDAWYVLFNQFLSPGLAFTDKQFIAQFATVMGGTAINQKALVDDPKDALKTYVNRDALSALGLLVYDEEREEYHTGRLELPDIRVLTFMLFDWWGRQYPTRDSIRFSSICDEPESLGKLCLLSPVQLRHIIGELWGLRQVTAAETQHEPVNRTFSDPPETLLQQYYETL